MRKTPLQRKKPLKRTKSTVRTKKRSERKNKPHGARLPSIKTMRNKCDKLLTPIVKAKNPRCLLCPSDTQVAHHHMKKSTSASCRYYLPNLIPLCHRCHMRLHADEILWAGRVIELKGIDWLRDLEEQKKKYVKTDVHYYIEQYELLSLHL